jgi:hypothetical protein
MCNVVPICTKALQKQDKQCKEIDHKLQCFASRGIPVLNLLGVPSILIMSATHIAPALCRGCAWFARPPDSVKQVFVFFIVTV